QISYSLVQRTPERDIIPMCEALDIAVLPWSPLASGVLSGKYSREDMIAEQQRIERGEARPFGDEQRVVGLTEKKLEIADTVKTVAEDIGRTASQVALNWLMRKRGVTSIILGARTLAHLDDNLACLDFTLDDEHMKRLDDVSAIELGFPHDFRANPQVRRFWSGDTSIEDRLH
ncbi:MAG: aldo/keto reductase, partial [Planctomycetota bacterium]